MAEYIFRENLLDRIKERINQAISIHLFLDYDGTLTTFSDDPRKAYPSKRLLSTLKKLISTPEISTAIISGRRLSQLQSMLNLDGITYAGLHGLKIQYHSGKSFVWDRAALLEPKLTDIKSELHKAFHHIEGILLEDKKAALGLHYRKYNGDPALIVNRFQKVVNKYLNGLEIIQGNQILEVRPKGWHKGKAVKLIRDEFSRGNYSQDQVLTIYIGDDRTDEDAFKYIKEGITICVLNDRSKDTGAQYYCLNPKEVLSFLGKLYKWRQADKPSGKHKLQKS